VTDSKGQEGSSTVTVQIEAGQTTETTTQQSKKSTTTAMFSASVNVEVSRKFGFDATAASKVDATMVAVPAPSAFVEAVKADAAGRKATAA
jgi:hypothetical protein